MVCIRRGGVAPQKDLMLPTLRVGTKPQHSAPSDAELLWEGRPRREAFGDKQILGFAERAVYYEWLTGKALRRVIESFGGKRQCGVGTRSAGFD